MLNSKFWAIQLLSLIIIKMQIQTQLLTQPVTTEATSSTSNIRKSSTIISTKKTSMKASTYNSKSMNNMKSINHMITSSNQNWITELFQRGTIRLILWFLLHTKFHIRFTANQVSISFIERIELFVLLFDCFFIV